MINKTDVLVKAEFVHKHLEPLVRTVNERVTDLEYMRRGDNEFVIVRYRGGANVVACVSRDSLATLARDVLKYI